MKIQRRFTKSGSSPYEGIPFQRRDSEIRNPDGSLIFEARDIEGKFSLRASVTSELFLQDIELPEENRLPGAHSIAAPLSCLTQARYGIAWGAIGAAMACYDEAVQYCKERVVHPITC